MKTTGGKRDAPTRTTKTKRSGQAGRWQERGAMGTLRHAGGREDGASALQNGLAVSHEVKRSWTVGPSRPTARCPHESSRTTCPQEGTGSEVLTVTLLEIGTICKVPSVHTQTGDWQKAGSEQWNPSQQPRGSLLSVAAGATGGALSFRVTGHGCEHLAKDTKLIPSNGCTRL